jgi:hypothetical protein
VYVGIDAVHNSLSLVYISCRQYLQLLLSAGATAVACFAKHPWTSTKAWHGHIEAQDSSKAANNVPIQRFGTQFMPPACKCTCRNSHDHIFVTEWFAALAVPSWGTMEDLAET